MVEDPIAKIIDILESGSRKVVLSHRNSDPDALASSYVLSKIFPGITISTIGGLNSPAKNLITAMGMEFPELDPVDLQEFDMAIVVDSSSPSQLEILPSIPLLVIDHHAENSAWESIEDVILYYTDPGKRSCSEIVYEIVKRAGKSLTDPASALLLGGILTDTGHFTFANADTLRATAELLEVSSTTLEEIHNSLNSPVGNLSKRIAKIRAAQRIRMEEFLGVILAVSEVNAFEGDAARSMLMLGADVAWVGSTRKDEYRISARASSKLVKMGFHMGNFLEDVGKEVNGIGGGHPGAAGLSGTGDAEAVLHVCKERFKLILRDLKKE